MATNDKGGQGSKQGGKAGNEQSDTKKRGFASMDPQQQREIAAEGGRAAHEKGTAHEFTSEEARRAGAMSHKNDPGSQQSTSSGSRGGSKGSDQDEDEEGKGNRGGSRSGSSGGSGSGS
jgi:hypothetical protein